LGSQNPKKLADAVRSGDRRSLAQAITLIESSRSEDRETAIQLLDLLTPHAGQSIRIGISGVPGVGKSTFIENFGNHIIDQGHKIAVLAVDPSSAISGGSILGDKTRMETLSKQIKAYIRPSPAGRTLGGVTRHTRETICIVEAAGFDVVVVETVGVGQSEIAVAEMTDIFMLMLLPGGGDELQGIKRGIIELADLVVVNKADGDLAAAANRAATDYRNALTFLHPRHPDWEVPVETCSALENKGLDTIWRIIERYRETMSTNGELDKSRAAQAKAWLWNETAETLIDTLKGSTFVHEQIAELEEAVASGKTSPWVAAHRLVKRFLQKTN
jgi:LAO/AO transport system kinase